MGYAGQEPGPRHEDGQMATCPWPGGDAGNSHSHHVHTQTHTHTYTHTLSQGRDQSQRQEEGHMTTCPWPVGDAGNSHSQHVHTCMHVHTHTPMHTVTATMVVTSLSFSYLILISTTLLGEEELLFLIFNLQVRKLRHGRGEAVNDRFLPRQAGHMSSTRAHSFSKHLQNIVLWCVACCAGTRQLTSLKVGSLFLP